MPLNMVRNMMNPTLPKMTWSSSYWEIKNPTMLIVDDEEQKILGVASLIYHSYFLRGKRSRLRLFHCLKSNPHWKQGYEMLTVFVRETLKKSQLDHAFLFIPLKETETLNYFELLYKTKEKRWELISKWILSLKR